MYEIQAGKKGQSDFREMYRDSGRNAKNEISFSPSSNFILDLINRNKADEENVKPVGSGDIYADFLEQVKSKSHLAGNQIRKPAVSIPVVPALPKEKPEADLHASPLARFLADHDFCADLSARLASSAPVRELRTQLDKDKFVEHVAGYFPCAGEIKTYESNANVIIMAGPTGIGKTTNLVKIASIYGVRLRKRAVLLTHDFVRIAATDHLEKYAGIMKIPFHIVFEKSELREVISQYIHYDYIFIDTAGTSQNDLNTINELADFISAINLPKDVFLVLNAASRRKEMNKILENFRPLNYNKIIISKIDEAETLGTALSAAASLRLPIGFFTNGQKVPNDIIPASTEALALLLKKEWKW